MYIYDCAPRLVIVSAVDVYRHCRGRWQKCSRKCTYRYIHSSYLISHKLYSLAFTSDHGDTRCIPNQTTWRLCTKSASHGKTIRTGIIRVCSKSYEKSKPFSKSRNPEKNNVKRLWTIEDQYSKRLIPFCYPD